MRWLSAIAFLGVLAAAAATQASAEERQSCLRWHDIDTITRSGPDTVLVKSRHRGNWQIKFKGRCDYQRGPSNYFIVRLHDRWECVRSLHVLDVHEGGACFIESVTPVK
jgi:predicted secreted Zn-dependent protease